MAAFKFNGTRAAKVTSRTGKEFEIPPGIVFEADDSKPAFVKLVVFGKTFLVLPAAWKRVLAKSVKSKAKPSAGPVKQTSAKNAPSAPAPRQAPKQAAVIKPTSVKQAPATAPSAPIDLEDFVWFKYAAPRGKNLKDARGNVFPIKAGTLFAVKQGRSKDQILLMDNPKAKLFLPTSDSDKLRVGAKPYKGKVKLVGAVAAPAAPVKPTSVKPSAGAPVKPTSIKQVKEKVADAATLKALAQLYGFGTKSFTGNMAKSIMKAAFDKGFTESMRKWLLRQGPVKSAAAAAVAMVEKWKPEGRFLPDANSTPIKVTIPAGRVPANTNGKGIKPVRLVNSPAVEFRPNANNHKPVTINLDDDHDDWGDGGSLRDIPELDYDDNDIPDSILDHLESDSSATANKGDADDDLLLEFEPVVKTVITLK